MSWDENCNTLLQSYPVLDALCIASLEGQVYGTTSRTAFNLTEAEIKPILSTIKTGRPTTTAFEIAGTRYILLRSDDKTLNAKSGKKSLFCAITNTLILIGMSEDTDQEMKSGKGNDAIYKLQDYYCGTGY